MKKNFIVILCMFFLIIIWPVSGSTNNVYTVKNVTFSSSEYDYFPTAENGVILEQELDDMNRGYTVLRVWGTDYEMGYAQADLIGDYIVQIVNECKEFLGLQYNVIRDLVNDALWLPSNIENELNGMVDCLMISHPTENIDKLDLKVFNSFGDWAYGCRSHSCWGRYVANPIKTLSTRRLDFFAPFNSAYHHVLCARIPDEGPKWANLAWPGFVTVISSINEYGTLVSLHDFQTHLTDFLADRMPRTVASRYSTTFATDPDISTHLIDTFNELQSYEIMTGTFLNYYSPEGNGGVMTCNPFESGPDFFDLRVPQNSWHHGEAIITTNQYTDGTYTPSDEDFGADDYYNNENPKTQESHWDLLEDFFGHKGLHIISLAYRNNEDMTIWLMGKICSFIQTPRLEYEWSYLFEPQPPEIPMIEGPLNGKVGSTYTYNISAIDPESDDVYFWIEWFQGCPGVYWQGPFKSGEVVEFTNTWETSGTHFITVRAKDTNDLESDIATLTVTIPRTKTINNYLLESVFSRFTNLFPIFCTILIRLNPLINI